MRGPAGTRTLDEPTLPSEELARLAAGQLVGLPSFDEEVEIAGGRLWGDLEQLDLVQAWIGQVIAHDCRIDPDAGIDAVLACRRLEQLDGKGCAEPRQSEHDAVPGCLAKSSRFEAIKASHATRRED